MSGYIGTTPVPQATQHREAFTANADQTTFATAGYTVGFIDVWLNGVKLAAADVTVTNGSDIVLASAAAANDIIEYVAFVPFNAANQTFTGATVINSLNINSDGATVTGIKDEDNMASNDANKLATQQSIKAYVDAQVTAQDLDFQGDSGGALNIDLDSETLDIAGGTNITTAGSGNTVTVNIAPLDEDNMASNSATQVASQQSIKAYVDSTVAATNEVVEDSSPQLGGDLASNGNDILMADNDKVILGTGSDLQLYHDGSNSYISNSTGWLNMPMSGNGISIANGDFSESIAKFLKDGEVQLFYNGVEKFNTQGAGVVIHGTIANEGATDFTIDVSQDLCFDSGHGDFYFKDTGTSFLNIYESSSIAYILTPINNQDLIIQGIDDGAGVDALRFDMSDGGTAIFNHDVKLGDSSKALFGAGGDLEIFHDGSHSYIKDVGTGNLTIMAADYLQLKNDNGELFLSATTNGSVELYHDNAVKLATTSGGVTITGTLGVDGLSLGDNEIAYFGSGSDTAIKHDGSNTKISHTGGGGLYIGADTFGLQNGAHNATHLSIDSSGAVTKPLQPAFSVHKNGTHQSNFSTNTNVVLTWTHSRFDQNSDFDFVNSRFSAPVTGKYQFNANVTLHNIHASADYYIVFLATSNKNYRFIFDPDLDGDQNYWTVAISVLADMDANDVVYLQVNQGGGSAQTDIDGSAEYTTFTGYLAC